MSQSSPINTAVSTFADALSLAESEPNSALGMLRRSVAEHPRSASMRAALAEALLRTNDLASAADEIKVATELAPGEAQFWKLAAVVAYQREHREDAIRLASRVSNAIPLTSISLNCLRVSRKRLVILKVLDSTRQNALALTPDANVHLITDLGSVFFLHSGGRDVDAYKIFQRAIALSPNDCGAHFGASLALARLGKLGEALTAAERAIELELKPVNIILPGSPIGSCGTIRRSNMAFERALNLDQRNAGLHCMHSRICGVQSVKYCDGPVLRA